MRGLGVAGHMGEAREMLQQAVAISQSQRLSGSNWHGVTREQARQFETVEATLRVDTRGNMEDLAKSTGADAGTVRHALAVAVPLAQVTFVRDASAGRYAGRVSVLALVRDSAGDVVEKLSHDYLLEGPLSELEATRRTRLTFTRPFRLPPGAYRVDTAVRDGFGERTGCGGLELGVATPPPGVRLSSVVPLAAVAPATASEDSADPFRVGDVRMTPALDASLRSGAADPLVLYYVAYTRTGGGAPEAHLEVGRGGRVFKRGAIELPSPDAGGRIPHVARVPLGALAPGEYTVRLSVTQGASTATEETLVRIVEDGR